MVSGIKRLNEIYSPLTKHSQHIILTVLAEGLHPIRTYNGMTSFGNHLLYYTKLQSVIICSACWISALITFPSLLLEERRGAAVLNICHAAIILHCGPWNNQDIRHHELNTSSGLPKDQTLLLLRSNLYNNMSSTESPAVFHLYSVGESVPCSRRSPCLSVKWVSNRTDIQSARQLPYRCEWTVHFVIRRSSSSCCVSGFGQTTPQSKIGITSNAQQQTGNGFDVTAG